MRTLASPCSRRVLAVLFLTVAVGTAGPVNAQVPAPPAPASAQGTAGPRGFIVGQVLDRESGRPLEAANIVVLTTNARAQSDLDGRFRIPAPVGIHSIRVFRLGNTPTQIDSIRVQANTSTTANAVLATAALSLGAVAVTAGPVRASSEDAMLAMQKAAPRVSDGISAEGISRAPGADASDAIVRVTGVSIVDNKFAVVRGLAERYSNTLLNGVELPSPEPLKKIVPLDLFPSSLLESIVVSKTATPDRPGDFAGGSVEVTTKEFPNDPVAEVNVSTGYGSQATFRRVALLPQQGRDWLGFDDGNRRQMPAPIPSGPLNPNAEAFSERLRNIWTPKPQQVIPDLGAGLNLGGRFGGDEAPYGYSAAVTYSRQTDATPNRLSQLVFDKENGIPDQGYVSDEATSTVDLGVIVNLAARLGQTQKIGWKNLYTRNAEESLARGTGYETYNGTSERVTYQARYIARSLAQTQLTGDHLLGWFGDSRFEWKGTLAVSSRDEPENRSLIYFRNPSSGLLQLSASNPSPVWFRFLDDRVMSLQADWSLPLGFWYRDGAQFKSGALYRERDREFDAYFFRIWLDATSEGDAIAPLPPEQAFAPENLGAGLEVRREGEAALPYESDDDIGAAYMMVDLPVRSWLRVVGGLRREEWRLRLFQGTREAPIGAPTYKRTSDDLWSANATVSLSDRQNLRFAFAQTVARPDPREVSPDYFVAITGDCANRGNPEIDRSRIMNSDVRWEFYPGPGDLISISAFHKEFDKPIAELLTYPGSSLCTIEYFNLENARILGGEIELRRTLGFLPGPLRRLSLGLNVTLVDSKSTFRSSDEITLTYRLQGQSDALANLSLFYTDPDRGLDASLLFNHFTDRIVRYGIASVSNGEPQVVPNVMEQGRTSVDAKLRLRWGKGLSLSLSGRNLLDAEVIQYQDSDAGRTRTGYFRPGTTVSLGMGYALR